MRQVTTATYEDGVLKPDRALPIADRQQVLIIVLPLPPDSPAKERVAAMQQRAGEWRARQRPGASRSPRPTEPPEEHDVLAEIRARAKQWDEAEIRADVEAALSEAEALSAEERARLDDELRAVLAG